MRKDFFTGRMWRIFITFLFMISTGCSHHAGDGEVSEKKRTEKTATPVSLGENIYVGSDKCKDCHWQEFDSWKHTLHSKFMQRADEFSVIGDFERYNSFTVTVTDKAPRMRGKKVTTTMFMKDGKYYVKTIGPDWELHDYEISYVIGVNRLQNYVTVFNNGEIHILPVEWQTEESKWEDYMGLKNYYPGAGKYWSDTERSWQFACGSCHVTGMAVNYNEATDTFNTTWTDLGIGCESCHGPGANHIQVARTLYDKEKDNIINPSKLPWKLRAMVCGQCHYWGASSAKVMPVKEGFPENYAFAYGYKVGQPLYLFYDEEKDDEKKYRQQYNEWQNSEHAKAGVICTTCHDVHQGGLHRSPHKSQTKYIADSLCTNCHVSMNLKAAHKIHTFGSCIACHMPKSKEYEHSHTFKFVSPEESLRAGGVDKKPNSCSGCHYHKDDRLEGLIEFLDAIKKQDMPLPYGVHKY